MFRPAPLRFLWAVAGGVVLTGCTYTVVVDRLDTYVAASFADEMDRLGPCVVRVDHIVGSWENRRGCRLLAGQTTPGVPIRLSVLALNSRDLTTAHAGKRIDFEIVDRDGGVVSSDVASITPTSTVTGSTGHNVEALVFRSDRPGTYRVRMRYADRATAAVGYSPHVHVLSGAQPGRRDD